MEYRVSILQILNILSLNRENRFTLETFIWQYRSQVWYIIYVPEAGHQWKDQGHHGSIAEAGQIK